MRLLDMRGGYLYQHRPDINPHGMLTDEEVCLWSAFYDKRERDRPPAK
jgi:hypothetical protein